MKKKSRKMKKKSNKMKKKSNKMQTKRKGLGRRVSENSVIPWYILLGQGVSRLS